MKKGKDIGKKSIIILTVFIILFSMFGNYSVLGDDENNYAQLFYKSIETIGDINVNEEQTIVLPNAVMDARPWQGVLKVTKSGIYALRFDFEIVGETTISKNQWIGSSPFTVMIHNKNQHVTNSYTSTIQDAESFGWEKGYIYLDPKKNNIELLSDNEYEIRFLLSADVASNVRVQPNKLTLRMTEDKSNSIQFWDKMEYDQPIECEIGKTYKYSFSYYYNENNASEMKENFSKKYIEVKSDTGTAGRYYKYIVENEGSRNLHLKNKNTGATVRCFKTRRKYSYIWKRSKNRGS